MFRSKLIVRPRRTGHYHGRNENLVGIIDSYYEKILNSLKICSLKRNCRKMKHKNLSVNNHSEEVAESEVE